MSAPITAADLRPIDLFDDLTDAELEAWAEPAREQLLEAGGELRLAGEGRPIGLLLLLEGAGRTLLDMGDRAEPGGRQVAPTWLGAISVLTDEPMGIALLAETECRLAIIPPDEFRRLILGSPAVHQRVMKQVTPVISYVTGLGQHRERLASLGTMAAGLAHELNNPAAAAKRSAAELAEALDVIGSAMAAFVHSGVERAEAEQLVALHQQAVAHASACTAMDTLDAADREDELLDRLEALGVPEPWRLAEPLAWAGVDQAFLDRVAELAGAATGSALGWIAASVSAGKLVTELQDSTERMSSLVGAIKGYAYMDRVDRVEVDVNEGLETTLVVLGHKLKQTQIEIARDYDREIPRITAHGGELNQVWTNLLDNAIDALGDSGTITVATRRDGGCAEILIGDDGPGIPAATAERIFDPFFTTKEVGSGTGLGLATARQIVADRHGGSISVESAPGRTVFRVRLPFRE